MEACSTSLLQKRSRFRSQRIACEEGDRVAVTADSVAPVPDRIPAHSLHAQIAQDQVKRPLR